jgi:putative membrane-bound dehydrogenase-like protein
MRHTLPRFLALGVLLTCVAPALAQREYGFDNRKSSGQPYLSPQETVNRFKVAEGFEVTLAAAEPAMTNPIAFTFDERGRLWIVECFEYPKRTPRGKAPRDRIKVLESTKQDGVFDKVTIFAEGKDFPVPEERQRAGLGAFDLASGIEVGYGGVFLGAPPYLWHLKDTTGDGKADSFEVLLKGFGSQDTHETLNTFNWGPDGRLYGLHGVFTQSEVDGVRLNAAVWRYDYPRKKFEVYAEGTSNPWGMDWSPEGECFLVCCVIPHMFHIIPGGIYIRQAGQSYNQHAYGLLPQICDHTFHKKSGWAHAGLLYLTGDHIPAAYRDSLIFGSIHGCSLKRNTLKRNGSTFIASEADDFLVSGDKNFRPINLRWGPDGAIYCIDWHDQNPCHQAAPDSWDYERGRVYRIAPKGLKQTKWLDFAKLSEAELVRLANDANPYNARTASRWLQQQRQQQQLQQQQQERPTKLQSEPNPGEAARSRQAPSLPPADGLLSAKLIGGSSLRTAEEVEQLCRASARAFAPKQPAASSPATAEKVALLRAIATVELAALPTEAATAAKRELGQVLQAAAVDPSPVVRRELASTLSRLGNDYDCLSVLKTLVGNKQDATDPVIPFMIWLALEPHVAQQGNAVLDWLAANATDNPLITQHLVAKTVRRLVATGKASDLEAVVRFAAEADPVAVRRQALAGLTAGLQNRQLDPPAAWKQARGKLLADPDAEVRNLAQRLAVNFRDSETLRRAVATLTDNARALPDRLGAARDLALAKPAEAFAPLLEVVQSAADDPLRIEALRALAGYDRPELAKALLLAWEKLPPSLRTETVNALAGRKDWARELLNAVAAKKLDRRELSDNTIERIRAFRDAELNKLIETAWGRVRETPAELNQVINKMRDELYAAPGSFARGRKVFENNCAKCHQFDGIGHNVGPALDGAGRDIEYLLANIIDPNRVIGAPYFMQTVVLKSGRVETGLLAGSDDTSMTLKGENGVLKVIAKKDVDEHFVQEKSLMPEGLAYNMTVQDFRDLVRYTMANPFVTHFDRAQAGVAGRLRLNAGKGEEYVATLTAPAAMTTRLLVGGNAKLTVLLNGQTVYDGTPGKEARPDQVDVAVRLREGRNELKLIVREATKDAAAYLRFLDPDRRLRYPD